LKPEDLNLNFYPNQTVQPNTGYPQNGIPVKTTPVTTVLIIANKENTMITYRQLQQYIEKMNEEQLDSNVTIHLDSIDEFLPVHHAELVNDNEEDRLDDGHPVLIVFD
jgi:hypothetical protein